MILWYTGIGDWYSGTVALVKRYKGTEVATSADIVATYWSAYCPYKWRRVDDEEVLGSRGPFKS